MDLLLLQLLFAFGCLAAPRVDLGYAVYEGNSSSGLDAFLGIQYAAPPLGRLRFAAPESPVFNHTSVLPATSYPPSCPQAATGTGAYVPTNNNGTSEDCLYLNIWAPPSPSEPLPVLIIIHGGGYKSGNGQIDPTGMIQNSGNKFIGVSIQYRLGAFGFSSGEEFAEYGALNAGLLDQVKAFEWVQRYIHLFGGDPRAVTISGNSAGAGSVMLHSMAYGGTLGTRWFKNIIATSPYLPKQLSFNDSQHADTYEKFLRHAGCGNCTTAASRIGCLRSASSANLIAAADRTAQSGVFAETLYAPVTDFDYIQDIPSRQLLARKVNGEFALVSNAADEGPDFTPQNITTEAIFRTWVKTTWPRLNAAELEALYATYAQDGPSIQQRADDIYAEATFVCPSYWINAAFPNKSWKYQWSVLPATHGLDSAVAFTTPQGNPFAKQDIVVAYEAAWINFLTSEDPRFSSLIANGNATGNATFNPVSTWPVYDETTTGQHVIFNNTCNYVVPGLGVCRGNSTLYLADANTWAQGRLKRCDFWREVGLNVPA